MDIDESGRALEVRFEDDGIREETISARCRSV